MESSTDVTTTSASSEATPAPDAATTDDGSVLPDELVSAIEAVLMVAERPIEPRLLAQLVEASVESVEATCAVLDEQYRAQGRGFILARVAGGYRYQSHPGKAAYVERFVLEGQTTRLSAAALETLAIVAYKQPISRAQVASIRGVSVDAVMRTLNQRGYIAEVSRDPGPGQAVMYGTTSIFLERLNINSILDLPELGDFVPAPEVVEALEHGLRFDDSEAPVESEDTAESEDTSLTDADTAEGDIIADTAPAEISADEEGDVVLDLSDSAVVAAQVSEEE